MKFWQIVQSHCGIIERPILFRDYEEMLDKYYKMKANMNEDYDSIEYFECEL